MDDRDYLRYVHVNLPHARTIVQRLGRNLIAFGALSEDEEPEGPLQGAFSRLEAALRDFDEDPAAEVALPAADAAAQDARALVAALLETNVRGDRLGQNVRNLFECLGLAKEGARESLRCGERADSPLRQ